MLTLSTCFLHACKDTLEINADKAYVEQGKISSEIGFGGIKLTLYPDGAAGILYGGDIFYQGKFNVKGNILQVEEGKTLTKFKIISNTELRYENNRILKLQSR